MALSTLLDLLPLLSFLLLLLVAFFFPVGKKNEKQLKLLPGPTKLPIIGNLHQLGHAPQRSLFRLSQKHGPLMYLQLGRVPTIVASSAATAKEILKSHDLDCCTRPVSTSGTKISYGNRDMVFGSYGDVWRQQRKMCIIEFFSSKKVQMFQSIREEEVERMVKSIASQSQDGSVVNLSEEMLSLANDITSRAALGRRYMDKDTVEGRRLPEMITEVQALLGGFFFADYLPALGWLDTLTGMRARLDKSYQEFDEFYQKVIVEHLGRVGKHQGSEDTMDALLRVQKETPFLTNDHIKALLVDIFIGGSDTSSATVEWTMTELMRRPEALKKAQDEVRALTGKKGRVEEGHLPRLHYMKCVLKEAMRLHPPVPLLVQRETMRDCKINGFDVPAKTRVIINALAIGRDEGSWENPEEFKPERIIGSSIDLKGHDFELIPFGAGRRICPGMHVGMAVVELALANLLYSFDWELPEGTTKDDIDMAEAPGLTVHMKSGLRLVARKYEL